MRDGDENLAFEDDYDFIEFDLYAATYVEDLETVQRLIWRGANVNDKNHEGWSPLMICASINDGTDVGFCLLQNGADFRDFNNKGRSPFMLAVINGHYEFTIALYLEDLLEVEDIYGKTALTYTIETKQFHLWQFIMSKKMNLGFLTEPLYRCPQTYNSLSELLEQNGLSHYLNNFEDHNIDLDQFVNMNSQDFTDIGIKKIGVIKKLLNAIQELKD